MFRHTRFVVALLLGVVARSAGAQVADVRDSLVLTATTPTPRSPVVVTGDTLRWLIPSFVPARPHAVATVRVDTLIALFARDSVYLLRPTGRLLAPPALARVLQRLREIDALEREVERTGLVPVEP